MSWQGNQDTTPITVDQMIYHARSVVRACQRCLVVCDMPFGSYQVSREDGIRNAIRIIKETGAGCTQDGRGVRRLQIQLKE